MEVEYQELQAISSTEEEGWTYTFSLPFWHSKLVDRGRLGSLAPQRKAFNPLLSNLPFSSRKAAVEFALQAIESPKGRHAFAMEHALCALEHLCSAEQRKAFCFGRTLSIYKIFNSAVLFFGPRVAHEVFYALSFAYILVEGAVCNEGSHG